MEDAHKLSRIPKSECPDIWIRLPRHIWPKSWSSMEDPVVPPEGNLHGHPLAVVFWEKQFEKILLEHGWKKFEIGNDSSSKQNLDSMWNLLNKDVDLGELSFLKICVFPYDLMTWKIMQRNVWSDIVSQKTSLHNNSTKNPPQASMTTTLKKDKRNLLENCHKYAF